MAADGSTCGADSNSSDSGPEDTAFQISVRSARARAGLNSYKGFDYRITCEGREPLDVDPIKTCFKRLRGQRIRKAARLSQHDITGMR